MADDPSAPTTQDPTPQPDNPIPQSSQPDPSPAPIQSNPNPNPNPNPHLFSIPPPHSYAPPPLSASFAAPPAPPSFRPLAPFTPMPNYQSAPGVPPPGVTSVPGAPAMASAPPHMMHYQMQQPMRAYAPMPPNSYSAPPPGAVAPPGLIRYPSPFPTMVRPGFLSRPPGVGMLPSIQRPPMLGIPGVRPIMPPIVRPAVPSVTPVEKPQTKVYVGKISPTVNNDFILSLLQLCGPVKSWKRAQDPTNGTPRGFGFCEFESPEGVLRALRLLSKFSIDGQELLLKVDQATREYLERFVEKKTENAKKLKDSQAEGDEKEGQSMTDNTVVLNSVEDNDSGNKESDDASFGIVTDEDKEADRVALEKLTSLIVERLKSNPLPPPPPLAPENSISVPPSKLRDADPMDIDIARNDASGDKNDEVTTSDNKAESEQDRLEPSSPERSRKSDKGRERDGERDLKQEKEREIERYERETERERIRKEREQRRKYEDAERKFEEYLKDWEYRERDKQKQRQKEKEREKELERKRKKEVINEEDDDDDDDEDSRKRWRRTAWEEKKKKRQREKEDDLADRLREEEEIAEANRRAEEEKQLQQLRDALKASPTYARENTDSAEELCVESKDMDIDHGNDTGSGHENHIGDETLQNGSTGDESAMISEPQQSGSAPAKKLGFGLVGSGKRASVPSVFKEEEEDANKNNKMRPLVPIDYSTEELQAVEPTAQGPSNLAAAAEFAKRISSGGSKEEKYYAEKERNRRANDRSSHRDRDRNDDDNTRTRDENKEKTVDREHGRDKPRTVDNKKLLDAKQLIDMIPKTKEELFSYEINWAIYEKHALHERMKPWISRKITEFLGEEEATLVDYIVSSTQERVGAERMLQLLQSILDEEAEMFVLKMWRMLIFEIKKVETGLPLKTRS